MKFDHGVIKLEAGDQARLEIADEWTGRSGTPVVVHRVEGDRLWVARKGCTPIGVPSKYVQPADVPRARHSDPHTSHVAAASQNLERLGGGQRLALIAVGNAGRNGLTDFELSERTGVAQTSIGKRRGELVRFGLVADSGRMRPAPSGSPAIVWTITEAGVNAYRHNLNEEAQ